MLIFICIFVAIAIIFGAVLGIISAVKKSRTVASYRSVGMDIEVASYFATQYKYAFMSSLSASGVVGVEDTLGFWRKDSGNGKSYGDILKEGLREYIGQVLVTNYLYDRYATLSSDEKKQISTAIEETLTYKADGKKDVFNKAVKEFGFSYDSYKDAVKMSYKSAVAQTIVCGDGGGNLKGESELVAEYLSEFSHVKLLFIRTETAFVLDDDGNRVVSSDGSYETRELNDEEKAERQNLINEIRGYIDAIGTGDAEMGSTMFDYYLEHNDEGDPEARELGYYFHPDTDFSKAFEDEFEDIAKTAYELSVGEFGEAEVDFGVCFVYKYETDTADLDEDSLETCFSDFYSDLSDIFFSKQISELIEGVEFDKRFDEIDILLLPYNYIYNPVF
ncbi:MAG: hypothetical protein E7612_02835 [Ruminococcaceae bacterium]|nr:hypothetical protein [Oscillospiraceae bacterium]